MEGNFWKAWVQNVLPLSRSPPNDGYLARRYSNPGMAMCSLLCRGPAPGDVNADLRTCSNTATCSQLKCLAKLECQELRLWKNREVDGLPLVSNWGRRRLTNAVTQGRSV